MSVFQVSVAVLSDVTAVNDKVREEVTGSKNGEFLLTGYGLEHRPVVSRLKQGNNDYIQ